MRTALVVTALLALVVAGCARERYASSYDDVIQARQRDAVERGWIPEFLPEGTTDLHEVHDPRARQHVVMGRLPGPDALPDEACAPAEVVGSPPLDAPWLPTAAGSVGTPVRCGAWDGTIDDSTDPPTLVLWTDWPDAGSPTPAGDDTEDEDAGTDDGATGEDGS